MKQGDLVMLRDDSGAYTLDEGGLKNGYLRKGSVGLVVGDHYMSGQHHEQWVLNVFVEDGLYTLHETWLEKIQSLDDE